MLMQGAATLPPAIILRRSMMEETIIEYLKGYGVFAVLFGVMLYFFFKEYADNKKEYKLMAQDSRQREEKLMAHIEKSDAHIEKSDTALNNIADKLGVIQSTQTIMQHDIEDLKSKID
jgi:hypothetical protein